MDIITLIYLTAVSQNFDPRLALSIGFVESGFHSDAVGKLGDTGVFQVRHDLVPETQQELFDPKLNTLVGIRVLKYMKRKCGDLGTKFVVCYNRGVYGGHRLVRPEVDPYYLRVYGVNQCLVKYSKSAILAGKAKECFR